MRRITFDRVSFAYRGADNIFESVSFDLTTPADRGLIAAVIGASGCGKTTLIRLVGGALRPTAGTIRIEPNDALVSYLPQDPVLFEHMDREANVSYYARLRATRMRFRGSIIKELAPRLRLLGTLQSRESVLSLSGGEAQRLSLLRALSVAPDVLLLDEPCTGLDQPVRHEFLTILRELVDHERLCVLYVTHHADEARLIADEVIYLHKEPAVGAVHDSIASFLAAPPSIEAAQMLSLVPLNVIDCEIHQGRLLVASEAFGNLPDTGAARASIAFSPDVVTGSTNGGGIRFSRLGRSAYYEVVTPQGNRATRWLTNILPADANRIRVQGKMYFFANAGERGAVIEAV